VLPAGVRGFIDACCDEAGHAGEARAGRSAAAIEAAFNAASEARGGLLRAAVARAQVAGLSSGDAEAAMMRAAERAHLEADRAAGGRPVARRGAGAAGAGAAGVRRASAAGRVAGREAGRGGGAAGRGARAAGRGAGAGPGRFAGGAGLGAGAASVDTAGDDGGGLRGRRGGAGDDLPAFLLAAVPLVAPAPQSPLELYDRLLPPPVLARLNDIAEIFLPAHFDVIDGNLPGLLAAPSDAASLASLVQAEGEMLPRSGAILRCASCAVAHLYGEPGYPVTPWSLPRVGRQWLYRYGCVGSFCTERRFLSEVIVFGVNIDLPSRRPHRAPRLHTTTTHVRPSTS
jgi:hypothetical protein